MGKKRIAVIAAVTLLTLGVAYATTDAVSIGYLVGIAVLYFKGFLAASKKKLILFLKTLTLAKAVSIGIKRFIIDNYVSKWLEKNVFGPIAKPLLRFIKTSFKTGKRRIFLAIGGTALFVWMAYAFDLLHHIIFFAEIKAIVIGFFKFLWIFLDKVFAFFYNLFVNSFFAPILQIFALSYLLEKAEKIPYVGKYVKGFFDFFANVFALAFRKLEKILSARISRGVRAFMRKTARKIEGATERMLVSSELYLMSKFIKRYGSDPYKYIQRDLHRYMKKKGFKRIDSLGEKLNFLRYHNEKTDDDVHFKGIFNLGGSWPPVRDVLVVESLASDRKKGSDNGKIAKSDAWLINLFGEPLTLYLRNGKRKLLRPGKIVLAKESGIIDAYVLFNNRRIYRIELD